MDIKVDFNTLIVFDLDDTLYNELDYLISGYKCIASYIDKTKEREIFSVMFSLYRNNQDVFEYLSGVYPVQKENLLSIYRNHKPSLSLDYSVLELFQILKTKSVKLALLTDGRSITQRNKLRALGIQEMFDYISISEEIGEVKPSLKGFQLIQNEFKREDCYYIGDNLLKDFIAPNKLNWKTICLIDNGKNIHHHSQEKLDVGKLPNYYIYSLKDIRIIS
ncbi:HAD family hydrolase [uncultured Tenacibaculum sp.]|uniref:HAD family hydrolase n=1 Tax=uncultured Tenacibaculum sp. TaxID=174713 RepID=UPI0026300260|nr:HAD family hydrolase [uncultured Tenacibaculum sp.]